MIGCGGTHSHRGEFGWPEVGYMLREECWEQGLRHRIPAGVSGDMGGRWRPWSTRARWMPVEELLIAITTDLNAGSHNMLGKCRWEHFTTWPGKKPGRCRRLCIILVVRRRRECAQRRE